MSAMLRYYFIIVAYRVINAVSLKNKFFRLLSSIRRGAGKSLAFPISYFPVCSITKRIFLGWVKEVRTTKS
jgi:hypothetical protein